MCLLVLSFSLATSCDEMESEEVDQCCGERVDLQVRFLKVLHPLELECENSIEWTVSSQQFPIFLVNSFKKGLTG